MRAALKAAAAAAVAAFEDGLNCVDVDATAAGADDVDDVSLGPERD